MDRPFSQRRFHGSLLNSSFDWNGIRAPTSWPPKRQPQRHGHDSATCSRIPRRSSQTSDLMSPPRSSASPAMAVGRRRRRPSSISQLGRGRLAAAAADRRQESRHETVLGDRPREVKACLEATTWYPGNREYFRGGGFVLLPDRRWNACDPHSRQHGQGLDGASTRRRRDLQPPTRFMPSSTTGPTPAGPPRGLRRASPARARSATSTRS